MTFTRRTHGPGRHGHLKGGQTPPLYKVWSSIVQRCRNPNSRDYPYYGGRGVTVCDGWLEPEGYSNFLTDVGPKPGPGYSLHRKDNDGPYAPGNVVWATQTTQRRNTRANRLLPLDGRLEPLVVCAEELRIRPGTLAARLRRGWPVERALGCPVARRRPYSQWVQHNPYPRKRGPKPGAERRMSASRTR